MIFGNYSNPWGPDSGVILALCKEAEVEDLWGTLAKVLVIFGELDKNE